MDVFLKEQLPLVAALRDLMGLLGKLSLLGDERFFLLVLPFVYWCVSRQIGRRLGVLLIGGDALNAILKVAFALPRPYWINPKLATSATEGSFGLPSSHAMNAASLWPYLALQTRQRAVWLSVAILLAAGIALSRVSLGVHFPMDVVGGALLGLGVLALFIRFIPTIEQRAQGWPLGAQIGVATLSAAFLLVAFLIARHIGLSAPFGKFLPPINNPESPFSSDAIFKRAGALWGLLVGLSVAARVARFEVPASLAAKTGRFILGIIVMLAIYFGLSAVFPGGEGLLPRILGGLRYALVSLWVVLGAPWLFLRLRLVSPTIPREVM